MAVSLNERITFTAQPANKTENDKKDAEKKVVTGGGAVAVSYTHLTLPTTPYV